MIIEPNNEWHKCILVKLADGSIGLARDTDHATKEYEGKLKPGPNTYWDAEVHWNKGQPIFRHQDGLTMSMVDVDNHDGHLTGTLQCNW